MTRPTSQTHSAPLWMAERFRPRYHYTAEKNMINDPNGLLYYDGEWHLFHQYNQHEVVHWGHAVSTDLVHWTHLPPAIYPDHNGQVYSGTAVVDTANTSDLRTGPDDVFVAFFTHADHHDGRQSQGLAYSNDRGRSWTMHPNNPILPNTGQKDFRDPKVFWHEASSSWLMVITAGTHLEFYRSTNLLDWTPTSSWGTGNGTHAGVWECPDLFALPVRGTGVTRWVLTVSVFDGGPAGGSGMQYFIGDFDGYTFTNDNPPETVLWHDHGKDFYAGITWENVPAADGRRLLIAWMDNWQYRFDIPTTPFNGQLSVVRELHLKQFPDGIRLIHQPVAELTRLRGTPTRIGDAAIRSDQPQPLSHPGTSYEVTAEFELATTTADEFGFDLCVGPYEYVRVGYTTATHTAYIDRSASQQDPHPEFRGRHTVQLPASERLDLRILVDSSSVEVFLNDRAQLTDLILPEPDSTGLRGFAVNGVASAADIRIFPIAPIWTNRTGVPVSDAQSGEWAATIHGIQGSAQTVGWLPLKTSTAQTTDRLLVESTVTILGTVNGNPGRILDEHLAGLTIGTVDTALAVVLNVTDQTVELRRGASISHTLARTSHQIATNTPYQLKVSWDADRVQVTVNDRKVLVQRCARPTSNTVGLYVERSEAIFTRPRMLGEEPA